MTNGEDSEPPTEPAGAANTKHEDGSASPAAGAATAEEVAEQFYRIDLRVHVSMRYHQARRAWYSNLNRLASVAAAFAGSTAIISVAGGNNLAAWLAAISGAFAALNAAWGFRELGFWNRVFKSWFTVFDDFPNKRAAVKK